MVVVMYGTKQLQSRLFLHLKGRLQPQPINGLKPQKSLDVTKLEFYPHQQTTTKGKKAILITYRIHRMVSRIFCNYESTIFSRNRFLYLVLIKFFEILGHQTTYFFYEESKFLVKNFHT